MGTVEDAITDLIKETIEQEIEIPNDEDIEKTAESAAESYVDTHLCDQVSQALQMDRSVRESIADLLREFMQVEKVVTSDGLEEVQVELRHEIEVRTLKYKLRSTCDRWRSSLSWVFLRRKRNARKVLLWTLIF